MNAFNIVFAAWVVLTAGFVLLMVYRGHLTQHETDQLFLNENASHNSEDEHNEILRRVNIVQPLCKGFGGAAALATVLLVGVYLVNAASGAH